MFYYFGELTVIVFIGVLIYTWVLSARMNKLEGRLEELSKLLKKDIPDLVTRYESPRPIPVPAYPEFTPQETLKQIQNNNDTHSFDLIAWFKKDFLLKVGSFFLLLALIWFVSYAFAENWIGPVGRITLGLLFGLGVLAFGTKRFATHRHQAAIFSVLGSTIFICTLTVARHVYGMFTPYSALGFMLLPVVYLAFVSVRYEYSRLALASLLSALLVPFMIGVVVPQPFFLMVYLLLIVIGTLWVVWYLKNQWLTLTALLGTIFYTSYAGSLESALALQFSFLFSAMFFATSVLHFIRHREATASPVVLGTGLITGLYLSGMIMSEVPEHLQSLYFVCWALTFSYGSYLVFRLTANRIPFYLYSGIALSFIGAATALELSGPALTILLTLEVLATVICASRLMDNYNLTRKISLLFLIPGIYTLGHVVDLLDYYNYTLLAYNEPEKGWLFSTAAVITYILSLCLAGTELHRSAIRQGSTPSLTLFVTALLYSIATIWALLHIWFTGFLGTLLALALYTTIGIYCYRQGTQEDNPAFLNVGRFLLGIVIIRLLLVDVWTLDLTGKIIVFFAIGVLFISTAFYTKKMKSLSGEAN